MATSRPNFDEGNYDEDKDGEITIVHAWACAAHQQAESQGSFKRRDLPEPRVITEN